MCFSKCHSPIRSQLPLHIHLEGEIVKWIGMENVCRSQEDYLATVRIILNADLGKHASRSDFHGTPIKYTS
jgi:hypothetical protein